MNLAASSDTSQPKRKPRRGDLLEVELTAIDARGRATGKVGEFSVQVRRGTPGARVRAEVQKRRGDRIRARTVEVLTPAPAAVEPRCPHFGACGGCSLQDLGYEAQLEEKRRLVERALTGAGLALADVAVEPCLGCTEPWAYRNKMDFTFSARRWREEGEPEDAPDDFALGLHPPGFFSKVLDVSTCKIQFPEGEALLADGRRFARELGLEPWDVTAHTGLVRHLVLRKGVGTGEILVDLVTSSEEPERIGPWAQAMLRAHSEITTLVQTIQSRVAVTAIGERTLTLFGPGAIRERLLGLDFVISAGSFFQTNTQQAAKLFALVRAEAGVGADDVVWDLYCGAGAISLCLAPMAHEVWGFEVVESAVADARTNARLNGIRNALFVHGDVAALIGSGERPAPDVVVTDPPRAGMHPSVVTALAQMRPRRLVYVSCNPASAAGDVAVLVAAGWRLLRVQPIDLFPHTPHVECVLTLAPPADSAQPAHRDAEGESPKGRPGIPADGGSPAEPAP